MKDDGYTTRTAFSNVTYDMAFEADSIMRESSGTHHGPERDRSSDRPDRYPPPMTGQRQKSTCCGRRPYIVIAVGDVVAGVLEAGRGETSSVLNADILRSPVGMMNEAP